MSKRRLCCHTDPASVPADRWYPPIRFRCVCIDLRYFTRLLSGRQKCIQPLNLLLRLIHRRFCIRTIGSDRHVRIHRKISRCSMHLRHRKKLWMMRISAWNSLPKRQNCSKTPKQTPAVSDFHCSPAALLSPHRNIRRPSSPWQDKMLQQFSFS